ncbi:MAG TPA: Cof-type HAD-IIB family hydrolase [Symbiobacteriaceae bacterium]|nr:Cof-type HAD-IIB family hydrolase [Symbiobacteriaceae bacterium]
MARFRLIVTDIDGTLVDRHQRVHDRNLAAIARFQAAGGLVTLGTGRIEASAQPYVDQIRANAPAILYNGVRIVDFQSGQVLADTLLPSTVTGLLLALLETAYKDQVDPILYSAGSPKIRGPNPVLDAYQLKDRLQCETVGDLRSLTQSPISKILVIGAPETLEALDRAVQALVPPGLVTTVRSEPTYLEFLPYGASKGSALRQLAQALGIDVAQVIAIGDQLNDLEMIRQAGLGVAVANAHPLLKEAADYICLASNEEGAVAEAIERFCLP